MSRHVRVLIALGLPALALLVALPANEILTQDPTYHAYADRRSWLGIPYAANVLSNLGFVVVGAWGLVLLARGAIADAAERRAWAVFFAATAATAFGSAWYHWAPDDAGLAVDRTPMAVAFASLFALVLGERVSAAWAARLLPPLIAFALASVAYWHWSGDLRLYVVTQFYPPLAIPLMLVLLPSARPHGGWWWALLVGYALAKLPEVFDAAIYGAVGIGGHAFKHLLAALAIGACVALVAKRAARSGTA